MMTARGFRRSRRISRLSAVRLKPPRPGAAGRSDLALTLWSSDSSSVHAVWLGVVAGQCEERVLDAASGDLKVPG